MAGEHIDRVEGFVELFLRHQDCGKQVFTDFCLHILLIFRYLVNDVANMQYFIKMYKKNKTFLVEYTKRTVPSVYFYTKRTVLLMYGAQYD